MADGGSSGAWGRAAAAGLLAVAASLAGSPSAGERSPAYLGRPVVFVLEELRARGVNVVYSSATVPDRLLVTVEPTATEPRVVLDQILAPLGLVAREGPAGALVVVARGRGRLAGRVTSARRRAPIAAVRVMVAGTPHVATTRPDGTFAFDDLPAGIYALRFEAVGFEEAVRGGLVVGGAHTASIAVSLRALPTFVEEIVVMPSRQAASRDDPASRTVLEPDDVVLVPTIGGDLSRALALLPGVTAPDNSAALNVRGGASRDVSVVLDGLELYDPFHLRDFQSPFTVIDGGVADTIALTTGGGTVDHGDRHGGFVEMATAPPTGERRGRVELGTMNTRLAYGGPAPGGAFLGAARAWYPDAVRDTIELSDDGLDPRFADAYATYSVTSIPKTVLSAHLLAARDQLDYFETDGAERVDARSTSFYVWLRALRSWSPSVSTETILSAGRLERERVGISEPEDDALLVDDHRVVDFFGLRHDTEVRLSSERLVRAGIEIRPLDARYDYSLDGAAGTTAIDLDPSGTSYAAYAAYRAAPSRRFAFEAGMRWDRQAYLDDDHWSPRAHAIVHPGERSELRLSAGRYVQSQRIHELNVPDGQTTFRPAERSDQLDLSFLHRFRSGLDLRVDAYGRRIDGVQPRWENLFNPLELFPETEADRVEIAPERAHAYGVEVTLRGVPDRRLYWWVSYARSTAVDVDGGRDVPRSWDQPHAGRGLIGYRWDRGWTVSLAASVHTGWPTTPVTGRQVVQPDGSIVVEPVLGPRNADRYPAYARWDVQASRAWTLRRGRLEVRLDLVNVTDRENVCCVDDFILDPRPDGSVAVTAEQGDWLGFTPSLAVAWEF